MVRNMFSLGLASALLFANIAAFAATVIVNDGDLNDYDPLHMYVFSAQLTAADPTVTFGFNLDLGEGFEFEVTAPAEFDLIALVSTGPDFGGFSIISPNIYLTVYAGTSFIFPISADSFASFTHWLTLSVAGIPEAAPFLPITIGDFSQRTVMPAAVVPVPGAVWLMISALAGLFGLQRRQQLAAA